MSETKRTKLIHRPCGKVLAYKQGDPYKSGDAIMSSYVLLADGTRPDTFGQMLCEKCGTIVRFNAVEIEQVPE